MNREDADRVAKALQDAVLPRVRGRRLVDESQPARRARMDAAVKGVLRPVLADVKAGRADVDDVIAQAQRRAPLIAETFMAGRQPDFITCRDCGKQALSQESAVKNGQLFCKGCAGRHTQKDPTA